MRVGAVPPECRRQPLQLLATPPRTRPHNSLKTRRLFNSETPAPGLLIKFLFISLVLTNFIRMVLILPCVVWPQIKLSFSQIIVVKTIKIGVRLIMISEHLTWDDTKCSSDHLVACPPAFVCVLKKHCISSFLSSRKRIKNESLWSFKCFFLSLQKPS